MIEARVKIVPQDGDKVPEGLWLISKQGAEPLPRLWWQFWRASPEQLYSIQGANVKFADCSWLCVTYWMNINPQDRFKFTWMHHG